MAEYGSIQDVVQQATGFAGAVNHEYQRQLQTQTEADIAHKKLLFQQDVNNEIMKIKTSNNYEDWQKQIDDFLTRTKNSMSDKNSPYYCRNQLTGDMFAQIVDSSQVQLTDTVNNMVLQKQRDNRIGDYNNDCNFIDQNFAGQEGFNQKKQRLDMLLNGGDIDRQTYDKELLNQFTRSYTSSVTNTFDGSIEQAVKAGESFDKLWTAIDDEFNGMKMYGHDGMEVAFDKKAVQSAAKQMLQQKYNAYVSDLQNKNCTNLSEFATKVMAAKTETEKNTLKMQGQGMLRQLTGLNLTPAQREHYASMFEIKNGKGGSSGSGSGSETKQLNEFKAFLKEVPDLGYGELEARIKTTDPTDNMSIMDTKRMMMNVAAEKIYEYGVDDNPVAQAMLENTGNTYVGLLVQKAIDKNYPSYANKKLPKQISDLCNDFESKGMLGAKANAIDYVYDLIAQDNTGMSEAELTDKLEKGLIGLYAPYLEAKTVKQFNPQIKDFENAGAFSKDKKGRWNMDVKADTWQDAKDVSSIIRDMNNNDMVYTDNNGKERWADDSIKKRHEELTGVIQQAAENALGKNLVPGIENTKDDKTSRVIFTDPETQERYTMESTGRKAWELKNIATGETVATSDTVKTKLKERKKEMEAENKKTQEALKSQKAASDYAEWKHNKEADYATDFGTAEYNKKMEALGIKEDDWNMSDTTGRDTLIKNKADKINREIEKNGDADELKALGVTKEEWQKLSWQQRQELIWNRIK